MVKGTRAKSLKLNAECSWPGMQHKMNISAALVGIRDRGFWIQDNSKES